MINQPAFSGLPYSVGHAFVCILPISYSLFLLKITRDTCITKRIRNIYLFLHMQTSYFTQYICIYSSFLVSIKYFFFIECKIHCTCAYGRKVVYFLYEHKPYTPAIHSKIQPTKLKVKYNFAFLQVKLKSYQSHNPYWYTTFNVLLISGNTIKIY